MQFAAGIHRLGNGLVNSYLLVEGGAIAIIDAGLPGSWSDLEAELRSIRRSLEDIRAIVLTHGHTDHIGFAEKARGRGVPVSVHEADEMLALGKVPNPSPGTGPIRPLPLLRFLALFLGKGGWRIARPAVVGTFGDGATLDVPGSPRVILVPGNTPGSAALHVPAHDVLFLGDALATIAVTTGETGPPIAPFSADPAQALASLDRLAGLADARLVLPGHGQAWAAGIGAAVAAVHESAAAATTGRR